MTAVQGPPECLDPELRFRGARDLPAGRYALFITVIDVAGLPATRRCRVTLA